jgi:hypothetical protein
MREVSTDEHLAFTRWQRLRIRFDMDAYLGEAIEKKIICLFMPVRKFAEDQIQQLHDFFLRQRHDTRHDVTRDVIRGGPEWTQQNARPVGDQSRPDALGVEEGGFQLGKVSLAWLG